MKNEFQIQQALKQLVHAVVDEYFDHNITLAPIPEPDRTVTPVPVPVEKPKPAQVKQMPTTAGKARICVICGGLKGITAFESGGGIICGLCQKKGISPLISEAIKKSKDLGLYPFTSKHDFDVFMNDFKSGKYVKTAM